MPSTYRLIVSYAPPLSGPPQDKETYWVTADELVQIVEDIVRSYENRVHPFVLARLEITRFGHGAALRREHLFDETGY